MLIKFSLYLVILLNCGMSFASSPVKKSRIDILTMAAVIANEEALVKEWEDFLELDHQMVLQAALLEFPLLKKYTPIKKYTPRSQREAQIIMMMEFKKEAGLIDEVGRTELNYRKIELCTECGHTARSDVMSKHVRNHHFEKWKEFCFAHGELVKPYDVKSFIP